MNPSKCDEQPLARLQRWYVAQCDGDWEHSWGVTIETSDNPGWVVTIDLAETDWADLSIPGRGETRSEQDWFHVKVEQGKFQGVGGPLNLDEILTRFLEFVGATSEPASNPSP